MLRSSCLLTLLFLGLATSTTTNDASKGSWKSLKNLFDNKSTNNKQTSQCAEIFMDQMYLCGPEMDTLIEKMNCGDWSDPGFTSDVCESPCYKTLRNGLKAYQDADCVLWSSCTEDSECDAGQVCYQDTCFTACNSTSDCDCLESCGADGVCIRNSRVIDRPLITLHVPDAPSFEVLDIVCQTNEVNDYCLDALKQSTGVCEDDIASMGCCLDTWARCSDDHAQLNDESGCGYDASEMATCVDSCHAELPCHVDGTDMCRDALAAGYCFAGSSLSTFIQDTCPYHCGACDLASGFCARDFDLHISTLASWVNINVAGCHEAVEFAGGCSGMYSNYLNAWCPCACDSFNNRATTKARKSRSVYSRLGVRL